ncbi:MAG: hypothetical protein NTX49_07005, partial [Chlamydiae bacterium]|nr:hypothetical protein [Chlamydiota bacterium]
VGSALCYGFLQIPPHDGHPCQSLIVPLIGPIEDFHSLVLCHASRTKKQKAEDICPRLFAFTLIFLTNNCFIVYSLAELPS